MVPNKKRITLINTETETISSLTEMGLDFSLSLSHHLHVEVAHQHIKTFVIFLTFHHL